MIGVSSRRASSSVHLWFHAPPDATPAAGTTGARNAATSAGPNVERPISGRSLARKKVMFAVRVASIGICWMPGSASIVARLIPVAAATSASAGPVPSRSNVATTSSKIRCARARSGEGSSAGVAGSCAISSRTCSG